MLAGLNSLREFDSSQSLQHLRDIKHMEKKKKKKKKVFDFHEHGFMLRFVYANGHKIPSEQIR